MGTQDIIDEARNDNKLKELLKSMEKIAYFGAEPDGFCLHLTHSDMNFWYQWEVWTSANIRKPFRSYESALDYFDSLVRKHGLKLEAPETGDAE